MPWFAPVAIDQNFIISEGWGGENPFKDSVVSCRLYGFISLHEDTKKPVLTVYCSARPLLVFVDAVGYDVEWVEGLAEYTREEIYDECFQDPEDGYWNFHDSGLVIGAPQEFESEDDAREHYQGNWEVPDVGA